MDTCQLVLKWDFKYSYPKIRSKLQSYCRVSSKLVAPGENTHIPQKIVISDVSSPLQHPATGSSCTLRWESPGTNHPVATLPWFRLFFFVGYPHNSPSLMVITYTPIGPIGEVLTLGLFTSAGWGPWFLQLTFSSNVACWNSVDISS